MEKLWLQQYPKGIDPEITIDENASLVTVFNTAVNSYREKVAYHSMGKEITYDELDHLSRAFAVYLTEELGMKPGQRVAIMMPNCLQYPIALFGALRAGMVIVNVNPLYTERELEHQLSDSGADAIVIIENFAHTLEKSLDGIPTKHIIVTSLGDELGLVKGSLVNFVVKYIKKMVPAYELPKHTKWKDALAKGQGREFSDQSPSSDDIAMLQYTGGTTGVAKGAMLTHRNLVSNVTQAASWLKPLPTVLGSEVIITALPLYHIFAFTANCLTFMTIGAKNVLITNPRDMPGFVKELAKHKFTAITGVNTLFNGLLNTPGFDQLDFSSLKMTLGGGMAVQRPVAERWQKVTGKPLHEAYGLTETSPAVTINPVDLKEYSGSIGLPISSTDIKIINDRGDEVTLGESGELCIKGPQVMKGYWNRVGATSEVLSEDGWLRTGDIARVDEKGFVYIVDRLKDMILVSGFNVYPNEIEEVLATHNSVLEAGVVGVPNENSGESVKAYVVLLSDDINSDQLIEYCREQMTRYKVPKEIVFVKELPKTNVGKILRRELRKLDETK